MTNMRPRATKSSASGDWNIELLPPARRMKVLNVQQQWLTTSLQEESVLARIEELEKEVEELTARIKTLLAVKRDQERLGQMLKDNRVQYGALTIDELLCPVCKEYLIEPVCLPCEHTFCSACIHQWTRTSLPRKCPMCRTLIRQCDGLRVNKLANRLLNRFLQQHLSSETLRERQALVAKRNAREEA